MKRCLFFLALVLFFASCGKDDDCGLTSLKDVIIGQWDVDGSLVEFKADGTIIDADDAFISGKVNGIVLNMKSYVIEGDSVIVAKAFATGGSLSFDFNVTEFSCNEMKIKVLIGSKTMKRK